MKNKIKQSPLGVCFTCGIWIFAGVCGHAQQPLGATVLTNNGGVTFRVWAPNATAVAVAGTFNGWNPTNNLLAKEPGSPWNGIWSNTVTNAKSGDQYKFVLRWPGTNTDVYQLDPRSLRIVNDGTGNLNSAVYDQQAFDWGTNNLYKSSPLIPVNQMVMYEMHVGTFYDPDPNDGKSGTFDDAIRRLPYLQRLGVNVIALMPVSEFFSKTSWGYNPQYPFAIEDSYGGPDAFKRFVREAHRLGMKVQLDIVHNHYASAGEIPELILFGGTNSYFYPTNTPIGRTKWGPRPKYEDPQVRAFIRENVQMFLDHYGVDGFRWDSPQNFLGYDAFSAGFDDVKNPQTVILEGKSLMTQINRMIHEQYSGKWSVAEDADLLTVRPDGAWYDPESFSDLLRVDLPAESFDGHWQTSFHNLIAPQIASPQPDLPAINSKVNDWSEPPGWRVIFTDNHDKSGSLNIGSDSNAPLTGWRLANRMDPNNQAVMAGETNLIRTNSMADPVTRKRVLLNAVVNFTAPGVPMLWMGQEFGATDTFLDERRLDWREASRQSEIFRAHRDLILLRTNLPALRLLSLAQSNNTFTQGAVLAYWHTNGTSSNQVYIAMNFASTNASLALSNLPSNTNWYLQMHTDWNLYGGSTVPSTNPLTRSSSLTLPAFSAVVLANTNTVNASRLANSYANVPDGWMNLFGVSDPAADDDQDGLSNLWESQNGLDPLEKDTATVVLDGVTNSLRAESNNPNVQFIYWATSAVTTPRFPTFRFLSNSITGSNFTNPAGGYVRLSFNLTNSNSSTSFFTPNTNLAVVDPNRTNWARFYGITNLNDNPDNDAFTNSVEFSRGSDPFASNRATICLTGEFNSWNASAHPMNFIGANLWVFHVPGRSGLSQQFKFTDGTFNNDWGDNPPANGIADFKGLNIVVSYSSGNGMYRFTFDENTLGYQVAYDPTDANGDGIQDAWTTYYGLSGDNALASADPDSDGLSNLWEFQYSLNPLQADTATVVLDGVTNSLRAESNNPNVQFIYWATSAVTTPRFPTFRFLSNSITGSNFTNPAGGYVRLSFNLTNSNSSTSFFTPNTNLAVVDTNRTNWARFYGITNLNDNPDNDAFTNSVEFSRGSDPYASNRAVICLAGNYNGWNESNRPMSFAGGFNWVGYVPGRQGTSEEFKFTDGTWTNSNWGDNPPANGIADLGSSNIVVSYSSGNGMYRFTFDENTLGYQVAYDPTDANGDGIQDSWNLYYGLAGSNALIAADPDTDGWSNLAEFKRFTNANGTFMNPAASDSSASPKRMTVTGGTVPLPVWQPNATNMTWSDQRTRWEWTGTFASSTNLAFKFSQATNADWSGGDSWGWNPGASNAGTAIRSGSGDIFASVTSNVRYRLAFNDLTGVYSISNYPISTEWRETNGLPLEGAWTNDTDKDGLSDLMEYSLGGNPNSAETNRLISSWATNQSGTNRLVLRWIERTNGGSNLVTPMLSTNLTNTVAGWAIQNSSESTDQTLVPSGHQRKEVWVPIDSTNRKFLRLRVTGP